MRAACTVSVILAAFVVTGGAVNNALAQTTGLAGSSQPIDNHQPSLVVPTFITTQGLFGIGVHIRMFAYSPTTVAGLNWTPCDGRLLLVAQNQALFAQLGTNYGGNGTSTFGLPDLRGRAIVGEGVAVYPGGSAFARGQAVGNDQYTLTAANMPAHDHAVGQGPLPTGVAGSLPPQSFDTMQSSLSLNYTIQARSGIFPPRGDGSGQDGGAVSTESPYLAQIHIMAGTPIDNYGAYACDGRVLPISQNTALFSLCGTMYGGNGISTFVIPDLRGRVAIGVNESGSAGLSQHVSGDYAGDRMVTLQPGNLPAHAHSAGGYAPPLTGQTGGGLPYQNMQPSLPMVYCIALNGVYPTNSINDDAGYIGEIMLFAGNFAPAGYVPCDGRVLPVAENEALYSLIGTTFGSGGPDTFRVPDLRGRTPVGPSATLPIGLAFGAEQTAMTIQQMPMHLHTLPVCPPDVGVQGGLPGHDGLLNNNDFIAFIQLFFAGNTQADMGIQGGLPGHDGVFDNNDFIVFISLFFDGCH